MRVEYLKKKKKKRQHPLKQDVITLDVLMENRAAEISLDGELVYGFETGNLKVKSLLGIRRAVQRL